VLDDADRVEAGLVPIVDSGHLRGGWSDKDDLQPLRRGLVPQVGEDPLAGLPPVGGEHDGELGLG
jgi:hypothetical protein